jgi:hypothetical protein
MKLPSLWVILSGMLLLAACSRNSPSVTACSGQNCLTPIFIGTLHPYQSSTTTPTSTLPLFKSPTPTPTSTVTPTPLTYKVRDDDDMYGIAFFYGISPQSLMTANPSVNPRAMSPGTVLIIPLTPTLPTNTPTLATPQASPTEIVTVAAAPVCYPVSNGGAWCFFLIKNYQSNGLESITGTIRLVSPDLKTPLEQTATTLLDLVPGGTSAPLVAYFPPPVPAIFTSTGEVTIALPQPENDTRYLPLTIKNNLIAIADDGKSANITGSITLASSGEKATQIWIAATAFDINGNVVGVRKWVATSALSSGTDLPFDFQVYTLGPVIDHITLMTEARP